MRLTLGDRGASQVLEQRKVRNLVEIDVNRIYPEVPFFEAQHIRTRITDILTIWALENPDPSEYDTPPLTLVPAGIRPLTVGGDGCSSEPAYRQGMHELLAPLVYVLEREQCGQPEGGDDAVERSTDMGILRLQLDGRYAEHDAYLLFTKMMEVMVDYFAPVGDGHVVCMPPGLSPRAFAG